MDQVPGGGAELWGRALIDLAPSNALSKLAWEFFLCNQITVFFFKLPAQNPILKNITDYLIEEVSAEEEELLGSGSGMDHEEGTKEGHPTETTVERDDKLAKVWLQYFAFETCFIFHLYNLSHLCL